MSKITKDELLKATLDGIIKAYKTYFKWSGEQWLWNAPEYLLTVKIAENIANIDKSKFVTLEDNVKTTLAHAGAVGQGRTSSKLRGNGRFDIVVWWAKTDPRAVIEVKHRVYMYQNIEEDINRICHTLKRKSNNSSINCGIMAFYMDRKYLKNAKEQIETSMLKIIKQAKEKVEYEGLNIEPRYKITSNDNENVYVAVVLAIRR